MSFSGTKGYLTKPKPGVMLNPLHPLSRGLVGYWLFNEGSGSLANDISGHGNHGMLTNMSPNAQDSGWSGSEFGGGLEFDGTNDEVLIDYTSIRSLVSNFSIVVWFNNDVTGPFRFYTNGRGGVGGWGFGTYWTSPHNYTFTKCGVIDLTTSILPPLNKRTQIILVVHTDYTADLYENGLLIHHFSDSQSILSNPNTNSTVIGADVTGAGVHNDFFEGSKDCVITYNRAISSVEAKQLYHDPFCNLLQVPIRRYGVITPPVGEIMNQFQTVNLGADLYQGAIIA